MGEIGFPRREFLFEISFWEVRRIIKGYRAGQDSLFWVLRHLAFRIMQTGMADLPKNGINRPSDILSLSTDSEEAESGLPSDEEIEKIRKELQEINRQRIAGRSKS